ncbi:MAG: uroporphyrinogen-III synthase [Desulfobacterales bacterium]
MIARLTDLGAQCLEYPVIKTVAPDDFSRLDAAIDHLDGYDWIIFTSVNGVSCSFSTVSWPGEKTPGPWEISKLPALVRSLRGKNSKSYGINTDILPEEFPGGIHYRGLCRGISDWKADAPAPGCGSRPVLPEELSKMGAEIDEIAVYHTVNDTDNIPPLIRDLETNSVDPDYLYQFLHWSPISKPSCRRTDLTPLTKNVTMPPSGRLPLETSKNGFTVHIEAAAYTIPGLCEAIVSYFQ